MKIKGKVIMTFFLSCIIIVVFFLFRLQHKLSDRIFDEFLINYSKQMEHIDFSINTYVNQIKSDLDLLALSNEVAERDDSNFTTYLGEETKEHKMGFKEMKIKQLFDDYQTTHASIKAVYMARENGSFVGKDNDADENMLYDPRKEEWYTKAKENIFETIVSRPNEFASNKEATLGLAKALINENNQVYGVIGVDLSLDFIKAYILALKMDKNAWIALINDDGRIIAAGNDKLLNKNINDFEKKMFKKSFISDNEFESLDVDGVDYFIFIYKSYELDLDFITFIPQSEVIAEIKDFVHQSLIILIGALVALSILVILLISKIIIRPIRKLKQRTEEISSTGNLTELITTKSKDEIGALAVSFNKMIQSLSEKEEDLTNSKAELTEYRDHLEELVKDRTDRLKKLTVAIEQNPSGILIADIDRTIEYVNDKFCEVRGYPRESIEGTKLIIATSGETLDEILTQVKSGEVWRGDMKRVDKNGEVIWENTIIAPMVNDGKITHFVTLISDITDRKKMETQLAENEKRLQNILDSSPATMYMKNLDGVYIYANKTFEETYGVKNVVGLVDEDIFKGKGQCIEEKKNSDKEVLVTKEISTKDISLEVNNELRAIVEYKFPLFDLEGEISLIGGWGVDITERMKAEQHSKVILESVGEGIVGVNTDGEITFINPAVTKILGYTQDELIGKSFHEKILHSHADGEKYEDETSPVYQAYSKGIDSVVRDEVLWKRDGQAVNIEYNSVPIVENGSITGAVVAFRDVDELAALNRNFVAMLESSSNLIYLRDKDKKITVANQKLAEFVSVDHWTQLIGKSLDEIFDEEFAKKFAKLDDEVFESEKELSDHIELIEHNNETRCFKINKILLKDKFGKKIGVYTITTDVTDLVKLNEELEKARDDAEAATKAKSDFLANMSHEIRTPMNAIIGLNNLLERTELNTKQYDYVEKIGRSAKNLLGIINDILDFSKIEAGKLDIENIEFNLEEVMDNLSNIISLKAYKKGLEFVISKDPEIPVHLLGDPLRLNQILLNLANNAIKFTEKGEVVVKAELQEKTAEDIVVRFTVKDTGIGMNEEQKNKLFKAFSQADTSTTRKYGGTGLGLSISKQLVTMMDGNIGVEAVEDEGSSFWFTAKFTIDKSSHIKKLIPDTLKNLKVMVVDDNESARVVLEEYLNDFNFEKESVSLGDAAIKEIQRAFNNNEEKNYDLILMDWKMPGLNGIETWTRIKDIIPKSVLPKIILVTSHGREDIIKQIEDGDISAVLMKPVGQSLLYDTILDVFNVENSFQDKTKHVSQVENINLDNIRGAKLLLVEDNEINQQVAKETLEKEGLGIVIAENGLEALDRMDEENEFEAILMDLQMPKMDGYEAARVLRKRGIDIPIIALSADAMEGTRARVTEAGMDDYVTKPIEIKELFAVLSKWLKVKERKPLIIENQREENEDDTFAIEKLRDILTEFKVDEGVARLGGKIKSYVEILKKFKNNNTNSIKEVVESLKNNEKKEAERILHTLKGVAGNIGATTLQARAGDLESELLNSASEVIGNAFYEKLNSLDKNLELIFREITELMELQQENKPTSGKNISIEELVKNLKLMNEYLEDYNSEASTVYDKIYELTEGTEYLSEIKKIGEVLGQYEFEEALERSESLIKNLN